MSESSVLVPNPQVLFTELDDGTGVLLNLDTKFYYSMNRTAVFVWKAISAKTARTTPEIAKKLTESFRVEVPDAERDVGAIVEEMLADGLLLAAST
jgi:Coenzyme PQQ synthesis protein D (PqqD)